jgi:chromate transporter
MTDGEPILASPGSTSGRVAPQTDVITRTTVPGDQPPRQVSPPPYSLAELGLYFLKLGTFGFGGPIALVGYMQRDLVERRRWIAEQDYREGLALAQLAPGPLAAQLAIYLGWVRGRALGATLIAVAFILPSFLMVLALSALYVRFEGLSWMQGVFYGIGAAVIAVIARSAWKLTRMTLARDRLLWSIFAFSAVITAVSESEIVWLFLGSGLLTLIVKVPPRRGKAPPASLAASLAIPTWLIAGIKGPASAGTILTLGLYFAEAGAFVFGSGLAIVPFLHGGVVDRFAWLDDRQFLDAVAVAMITPGPVVITVGFIGYLVAGVAGASVAALGVFLPCYLLTVIPAPHFRRWAQNRQIRAFVDGVTAAATGAIAGAAFVLGRRAIVDFFTAALAIGTWVLLTRLRKVPEPVIILVAGCLGMVAAPFRS